MNWLPSFTAWPFALAGLILAGGPVLIHLLNRRRFRQVEWAAMDLLREALQRNRRVVQLRDILLMLLRAAVVACFGFALAQPHFSSSPERFDGRTGLHAVLLIDNSLSMGYLSLDGDLLERAKRRAADYIESLPADSLVTVIPLCGSAGGYQLEPFLQKVDAHASLESIAVIDRQATMAAALNEARRACEAAPQVAKRIVVFSDQQRGAWRGLGDAELFAQLPSLQLVDVGAGETQNAWISDVRLQDDLADTTTPATIVVEVQFQGSQPQRKLQVTLEIDGREVASRSVTLDAGPGAREVTFQYAFEVDDGSDDPLQFVPVVARLTPDRLPQDDERHVMVPVVRSLPIVFVDAFGSGQEDELQGKLGETRHLRRLLSGTLPGDPSSRLIEVRHVLPADLTRDVLADARMAIVAGIRSPQLVADLLREYVGQGGPVLIAAGSDFDPVEWNRHAWSDGRGILPAPLRGELIGAPPGTTGNNHMPFSLSYESLRNHPYFQIAGAGEQQLRDFYLDPLFFQAVDVDVSPATMASLRTATRDRWQRRIDRARQVARLQEQLDQQERADIQRKLLTLELETRADEPAWLEWQSPEADRSPASDADEAWLRRRIEDSLPRVLARYELASRTPFLVERRLGKGTTMFVSSGLRSRWNTLPLTNTVAVFNHIIRSRVRATLPRRNFATQPSIRLPMPVEQAQAVVQLRRPGKQNDELLEVGFLDRQRRGVEIDARRRGIYRIAMSAAGDAAGGDRSRTEVLAVAGPPEESQLDCLTAEQFAASSPPPHVSWVSGDQPIRLSGSQVRGQDTWRWLVYVVIALLAIEIVALAWSARPATGASQPVGQAS